MQFDLRRSPWLYSIVVPGGGISVCGVQTFGGRGVLQPERTLPIEIHGRLFAVLSSVPAGPAVVTGQVPVLFVTRPVAVAHHSLCLVHPGRARHKVLHGGHGEGGLSGHDGVGGQAAVVGRVHHGERGAAVVLLRVDVAVATQRVEGQERESKHGRS